MLSGSWEVRRLFPCLVQDCPAIQDGLPLREQEAYELRLLPLLLLLEWMMQGRACVLVCMCAGVTKPAA